MGSSSQRNKPAALGSLLASSREAAARYAGTAVDREQWRQIVGERIAARTEPGAKRGRELTVHVASASWAQELSLLVNEILVGLKAAGIYVDTVRFRVKEIAVQPRDAAARKPIYRKAPLPSALATRLEGIEDAELRDAISEAAALWLALDESAGKARATLPPAAPVTKPPPAPRSSAPTSAQTNARALRAAESQTARSERRPAPGRARSKDKP